MTDANSVIRSVNQAEEETTDAGGISLLHGSTRTWPAYRRLVTPWTPTEEA